MSRRAPPRRRRAEPLVAVALAIASGCMTAQPIDRADWGAIPPDATIRVTTADGATRNLTEVTVFTDALEGVDEETSDPVRLPLASVQFVEDLQGGSSAPVFAAIAVGISAIGILVAAGRSATRPPPVTVTGTASCPFLYSFDGQEWVIDSETYAGAITRGLERTDLDNLEHLRAVDGRYRLLLTNERPETEYTDALSLLVVDHPEGTHVLPDATGMPRVLADPVAARTATGLRGGDVRLELERSDGRFWLGDPVEDADLDVDGELRDGVVLTFPRPSADRALLAVRAQNTGLAPLALRMFLELQGEDLVDWYRRVDHDAATQRRLRGWVMREGTLHVSVWIDGAWQLQDMLLDVGPVLAKTQVAELDLGAASEGEVRVRLESARGLWTLDWVALGTESTSEPTLTWLAPSLAVDQRGRELEELLGARDGTYYTALEGDRVELEFRAPPEPAEGWSRSVLVQSTGFYHIYARGEGPARAELADRILSEPLFGNRYLLGRLRLAGAPGVEP